MSRLCQAGSCCGCTMRVMMDKSKVLISGAEIAGLTATIGMQQHGFAVTVVEKAGSIRSSGFLVSLAHHAYPYAEQLGIR